MDSLTSGSALVMGAYLKQLSFLESSEELR